MKSFSILVAGIALAASVPASAETYTEALSKCLIGATTPDDRGALMRWLYATASSHPAVKSMSNVSAAQVEESNKMVGEMITKLLTMSCKPQAQNAYQHEGSQALRSSFEALSEVADHELFSGPEVEANMAEPRDYVDVPRIKEAVGAPPGPQR